MKRENSISGRVYTYITEGNLEPWRDAQKVAEGLEVDVRQVKNAVLYLRHKNMLPSGDYKYERSVEHKKKISERHSTTWSIVKPLVARNGTPSEIADITGLRYDQVAHAVERSRSFDGVDSYFSEKSKRERDKRSNQRRAERTTKVFPTPSEKACIEIARELFAQGLIFEEVGTWQFMKEASKRNNRNWFKYFAEGIVVEAYAVFKHIEMNGNGEWMKKFIRLAEKVDRKWFYGRKAKADRALIDSEIEKLVAASSK